MADGKVEGLFLMGQNPAVGGANSRLERKALAKLKWLVVRDMVECEPASFWYNSPEVERGELIPRTIATEVFLAWSRATPLMTWWLYPNSQTCGSNLDNFELLELGLFSDAERAEDQIQNVVRGCRSRDLIKWAK